MDLTPEQREEVAAELKRFGADLNLTEDQKQKLSTVLTEARSKVADYLKTNPNMPKGEIISKVTANREAIRQRLVNFLTPEQLTKWDAEAAKAKEFLGQKLVA
jgi:periplasmic protein CpxP/Spy